ncbi:MAG: WYL domain-containing protein, partial [Chitinophagaceae bacterium]|nr:WYL domain-containing protein [Anaerolineae bacterium]
ESEVRALFVSSSNKLLSDVGLDEAANNTRLKLLAGLPQRHQSVVDHIRQRIHIDPLWWWYDSQSPPFWVELQNAVYEDRYIYTVYENYDGKTNERILEPYSLVAKSSFWYLIAKREGEFRTYRVSRFQNVEMQNLHFQRDKDFDLASYWQDHLDEFAANLSMFSFTLRIHNSRINFAKWLAPGRHEIMREADELGWFIMRFHYESIDLAKMLVFGLGIQAVVIEPQELHDAVLEDAQAIIRFNHR